MDKRIGFKIPERSELEYERYPVAIAPIIIALMIAGVIAITFFRESFSVGELALGAGLNLFALWMLREIQKRSVTANALQNVKLMRVSDFKDHYEYALSMCRGKKNDHIRALEKIIFYIFPRHYSVDGEKFKENLEKESDKNNSYEVSAYIIETVMKDKRFDEYLVVDLIDLVEPKVG